MNRYRQWNLSQMRLMCVELLTSLTVTVFHPILHKFSNGDLIRELAQYWHKDKFKIVKVKSHRKLESATDLLDLWYIAGNMAADAASDLGLPIDSFRGSNACG